MPVRTSSLIAVAVVVAFAAGAHAQGQRSSRRTEQTQRKAPTLEDRADGGDIDAQMELAEKSKQERREPDAVKWYYMAAKRGHDPARRALRTMVGPLIPPPAETVRQTETKSDQEKDTTAHTETRPIGASLALALAALAVMISIGALVVSWSHTRRTLRNAGLL